MDKNFDNITVNNKNLTVNGTITSVNKRSITPIVYNPLEKDVELSKYILDQFKTYDLQIENLIERVGYFENKNIEEKLFYSKKCNELEQKVEYYKSRIKLP